MIKSKVKGFRKGPTVVVIFGLAAIIATSIICMELSASYSAQPSFVFFAGILIVINAAIVSSIILAIALFLYLSLRVS